MAIKITYCSETIDNWGRTNSSTEPEAIRTALTDIEGWTDDMTFHDEYGNCYFIDDLAGKEVELEGIGTITVPTDN